MEDKQKTLPCPACGKQLVTPKEYFPALHNIRKEILAFKNVIIADNEAMWRERALGAEKLIYDFVMGKTDEKPLIKAVDEALKNI